MKISKLIFCIDALELTLVEKYGLRDLMQEEYGAVEAWDEYPLTESIWASFITGVPPEVHGIDKNLVKNRKKIYKSGVANFMNYCLSIGRKVKDILLPGTAFKIGLKLQLRLAERYGTVPLSFRDIKVPTILDNPATAVIGFPLYDDDFMRRMKHLIGKYYYSEISPTEFYNELQREYEINQAKLNSLDLSSNSTVFIYYFILDVLNHLWHGDAKLIRKEYLRMNDTFRDLKHRLNPDFSLVISDHGGLNGEHTMYGFYSVNIPLNLRNPKITDFKKVIEEPEKYVKKGAKKDRSIQDILFERKVEKSKQVIREALRRYGKDKVAVAWTTGKDSQTILSLIREMYGKIPVPVLFFDTTVKFKETYEYRDKIAKEWDLDLRVIKPEIPKGFRIAADKEKCCHILKVLPAKKKIRELGLKAVVTGIRWDEHEARAREEYFSEREDHVRVHPLLHWSESDVWRYLKEKNIPLNPLYAKGYRSLGCEPCTRPTPKDGAERSGRAQDKEKIMARLRALGYW